MSWDMAFNFKYLLLDAVLLIELINTAAGINELLLAGVEGVALGADFNGDALTGGAGLDGGAACALDNGGLIVRMDSCLHCIISLICCCLDYAEKRSYKTQSGLYHIIYYYARGF